ncbi:hypothetical protein [Mesorhizobium sp. M0590]|uniref:hypothetical protein n=1 Tax=Mesorhizobium sp. M0590 TaxID=2956966 RepID=UPI00333891E6
MRQRTQLINALRGHLAEFGIVVAKGPVHLDKLNDAIDELETGLPPMVREIGRTYLDQIAVSFGRKPRLVVAIALANKMARAVWAMLTKKENYWNPVAAA